MQSDKCLGRKRFRVQRCPKWPLTRLIGQQQQSSSRARAIYQHYDYIASYIVADLRCCFLCRIPKCCHTNQLPFPPPPLGPLQCCRRDGNAIDRRCSLSLSICLPPSLFFYLSHFLQNVADTNMSVWLSVSALL